MIALLRFSVPSTKTEPKIDWPASPTSPSLLIALPSKKNVSFEVRVIRPPVATTPAAAARPSLVPSPEVVTTIFLPSGAVSTNR